MPGIAGPAEAIAGDETAYSIDAGRGKQTAESDFRAWFYRGWLAPAGRVAMVREVHPSVQLGMTSNRSGTRERSESPLMPDAFAAAGPCAGQPTRGFKLRTAERR
jgi:hypothetical protein